MDHVGEVYGGEKSKDSRVGQGKRLKKIGSSPLLRTLWQREAFKFQREREISAQFLFKEMETKALGVCQELSSFYLTGVALRSFFLVLATHLLAGEVDTTLRGVPLLQKISWWFRYYNPLNLSWRYYSMFAYRFTAHSWGSSQLALINHEEHPLLPPLPYVVGETVGPLRVRRLEMAGLLSSQGILTFSAAYQGALAIQYAISTEGIPYLPNTTVPLAMVGLFRVMASRWVASKIQVDAYPYPSSSASECIQLNVFQSSPLVPSSKSSTDPSSTSSPVAISIKDPSSASLPMIKSNREPSLLPSPIKFHKHPSSISKSGTDPNPPPITKLHIDPSSSLPSHPPSPLSHSPCRPLLPTISPPDSLLSSSPRAWGASVCTCKAGTLPPTMSSRPYTSSLSQTRLLPTALPPSETSKASTHMHPSLLSFAKSSWSCPCSACGSSTCVPAPISASSPSVVPAQGCQVHQCPPVFPSVIDSQQLDYKTNKFVVGGWIGVLVGLVTMSFLPYKVAAAYQLPRRLLQFSMQFFYQYIAVSEFVFHVYLLYQGPRALANRVLFFDHWTFKAQTVGFYCLLLFMLVIALIDFVRHEFYRTCA